MWSYEMESHGMEYPFCILSDSLKWTLHYGLAGGQKLDMDTAGGHLFKKKITLSDYFQVFFLKKYRNFSSRWENSLLFSDLI